MRSFTAVVALLAALSGFPALAANPGPVDSPPLALGIVRPTLDFTTLKGGDRPSWDKLAGKFVVMDFWATWCTPCIADFPKMNALQAQFAGKPVVFYSVTYEKPGAVHAALAKWPLDTNVGLDNDFHTFKAFNAWGIPVAYIFDKSGRLVASVHPDHLDATVLNALMDGKPSPAPPAKAWSDPAGAETYFRSLRDKQSD